jgi:methionyl-tRNA formyltransferase
MNILLLGPERRAMVEYMSILGDKVKTTEEKLTPDCELIRWGDFLISYGYRHIIKPEVLEHFPRRAINLHIAYLPYNRGADPNLWSFLEDSPKGVTVHYLDHGLDTGNILVQQKVDYRSDDTLRTSYNRLAEAIESLFTKYWLQIRDGNQPDFPQPEGGTIHRLRDREKYEHLLTGGWDTPVSDIIGRAAIVKQERGHEK